MMEVDESKGFMLFQDNGDGTTTMTARIPEFDDEPATLIIEIPFVELMEMGMLAEGAWETNEKIMAKATEIPNDVDL